MCISQLFKEISYGFKKVTKNHCSLRVVPTFQIKNSQKSMADLATDELHHVINKNMQVCVFITFC